MEEDQEILSITIQEASTAQKASSTANHHRATSPNKKDYHVLFRQNFLYDAAKYGKVDQFERMLFKCWQSSTETLEEDNIAANLLLQRKV